MAQGGLLAASLDVVTAIRLATFASLIGIALLAWLICRWPCGCWRWDMGAAMTRIPRGSLTRSSRPPMWAVTTDRHDASERDADDLPFAAVQRRHAARRARAVTIFVAGRPPSLGRVFPLAARAPASCSPGRCSCPGRWPWVQPGPAVAVPVAGLDEPSRSRGAAWTGAGASRLHHRALGVLAARAQLRMGVGAWATRLLLGLMPLLFAGGVMNLTWVAALAALVSGSAGRAGRRQARRAGGIALSAVGVALLFRAIQAPDEIDRINRAFTEEPLVSARATFVYIELSDYV